MWLLVVLLALVIFFDGLACLGLFGRACFLDYREERELKRRGRK